MRNYLLRYVRSAMRSIDFFRRFKALCMACSSSIVFESFRWSDAVKTKGIYRDRLACFFINIGSKSAAEIIG